jgi:hypothetical protein
MIQFLLVGVLLYGAPYQLMEACDDQDSMALMTRQCKFRRPMNVLHEE